MKNKRGQIQSAGTEESVENGSEAVAPVENKVQEKPRKQSKMWLWIIIGLIAIGVISVLLWFLLAGGEGSVVGNGLGSSAPTPPSFPN